MKFIFRLFRNIHFTLRFFKLGGGVIGFFALSFAFPFLFFVSQIFLCVLLAFLFVDIILLFNPMHKMECNRIVPRVMSLGDENKIRITVFNRFRIPLNISIIDELPGAFQIRNFSIKEKLDPGEKRVFTYELRPVTRGEYFFGNVNIYSRSFLSLIERRIPFELQKTVAVYPSIIQMKKFELKAFTRISSFEGIKKMRRIGHSYEFEQIKKYVRGDDYRSINWKATSRKAELMVNQYEDEKSQQIYSVIDKSRTMHMPFDGLSLLDYAINSTLVISNIALRKQDKAGLLTFSDKIGVIVKAERSPKQLNQIIESLYRQKPRAFESNYELLYSVIRNQIKSRSLIFLFTNFESTYALERALPILRKISRLHLLVVVFFENTEISGLREQTAAVLSEIYLKTIAMKFTDENHAIVQQLRAYGIQSILTTPNELSLNTVNKYLELKSRGMI